jgi:hypothetical protein
MTMLLLLTVNCVRITMSTEVTLQRKTRKFVDDDDAFVYVHNNSDKDATVHYWTCERKNCCRTVVH